MSGKKKGGGETDEGRKSTAGLAILAAKAARRRA